MCVYVYIQMQGQKVLHPYMGKITRLCVLKGVPYYISIIYLFAHLQIFQNNNQIQINKNSFGLHITKYLLFNNRIKNINKDIISIQYIFGIFSIRPGEIQV